MFENISRTRPACSFAALPFSGTVKPKLMEVWLQDACKQFVINRDRFSFRALPLVLEQELESQSHLKPRTEIVLEVPLSTAACRRQSRKQAVAL
jgi:hypothetical protein